LPVVPVSVVEKDDLSSDAEFFRAASEFLSAAAYAKAMAGARQHGGHLWSKNVQGEVLSEQLDGFMYTYVLLNVQIPKVRMLLDEIDLARIEGDLVGVAVNTKKARNVLTHGNVDGPLED
jgi:hypothetical protein